MKKRGVILSTIVQKYGGTSMGSIEKIKSVAKKVILEKEKGNDVVVVVSAMGKTTNKLVDLAKEISVNPYTQNPYKMDDGRGGVESLDWLF